MVRCRAQALRRSRFGANRSMKDCTLVTRPDQVGRGGQGPRCLEWLPRGFPAGAGRRREAMDDEALEEEIRQQYEFDRSFPPEESLGSGPVLPARDATPKSASRAATPDDSRVAEATTPKPKATQGRGAGSSMEGATPTPQARTRYKRPPGSPVLALPVPKRRLVAFEGGLSWRRLRDDVYERSSGKEDQQGEAADRVGDRLERHTVYFTAFPI